MKISKKEKNEFLTHVPRSAVPKYQVPRSKTVTCRLVTKKTDRNTKDKEENTRKLPFGGPSKGQKSKFRKKKKCVFDSCPKDYYAKKLGSQVKNCDLQVKNKKDKNQYKGKEENTRQKKRGGPSKGPKSKFRKNKKPIFYYRPKDYCAKKLGSQVKNCDLQHSGNTHTDRQTEVLKNRDPIRALAFQAFACYLI